ncbi:N-acetyltransferase [Desulfotomaculum defluvii]
MLREYKNTDDQEIIQIWYDASILAHDFISPSFWASERKNIKDKYLPMAETYVKLLDGKIVGFISLINNYIGALFVAPEHQGKGIGSELITKAKTIRNELEVEVYKDNLKAHNFYQKCGFININERIQPETGCLSITMSLSS